VDYILFDHLRELEVMHSFRENHIYLIEVFCPLRELKRREATRCEKRPGQTHLQYFLTAGRWQIGSHVR
jgi:chloramphenicol 3-O-phosphotransferase